MPEHQLGDASVQPRFIQSIDVFVHKREEELNMPPLLVINCKVSDYEFFGITVEGSRPGNVVSFKNNEVGAALRKLADELDRRDV